MHKNQVVWFCVLFMLAILLVGCSKTDSQKNLEAAAQAITDGDRESALAHLKKAVDSNPKDPVVRYRVMSVLSRPGYHKEQVEAAKNLVELMDTGAVWPGDEAMSEQDMFTGVAIMMDKGTEYQLAQKCYEKALEAAPQDPGPSNNLAYFFAERQINLERAEELARFAYNKQPKASYINDTLGWVCYRLGKYDEAKKYLRVAVEKSPNSSESRYHLAAVYAVLGEKEQAKVEVSKALSLNPAYKDAQILSTVLHSDEK